MTEPEDTHSSTRPISVAELLARNGSIGSPPVGGRRRHRRGNADSVTVAELTGEIPIIRDSTPVVKVDEPVQTSGSAAEAVEPVSTNGVAEHVESLELVEPVEVDEHVEVDEPVEVDEHGGSRRTGGDR